MHLFTDMTFVSCLSVKVEDAMLLMDRLTQRHRGKPFTSWLNIGGPCIGLVFTFQSVVYMG